jgi:sialidase-1
MIIEKANSEIYSQCRIPGIVITEKGTLLAYYECRRSNSDWADIDIKIIRSTDEGDTWQTVTVISGNGNTLNNPVMFVKGEELHFLFLKNYKTMFHCVSTNDGQDFSVPEEKTIDCGFFYNAVAVGPGHGIIHGGKMIVPVWFAQNKEDTKAHHPSVIATLHSTDGGKWFLGELIGRDILVNPSECALVATADDRVLISIRNENDCRQRAFALSDDGVGNWKNIFFHPKMPDPVCMGSMCCEGGKIYHINCASHTHRENLTVKISKDNFKSFKSIFVDTPGGYADIAVKNDTMYILYERDCINGGLYFTKIRL